MTDRPLPDPSPALTAAFRAIHAERMQGLPFVNPAIGVEAVGFAPWKHYWLGAMVTPWSINLVLTPRDPAVFRPLPCGEKRRCLFPAGAFDFIGASDVRIGDYLVCSLFSPVLEFADHATARETARVARDALLDAGIAEGAVSRRDLLRGRFREHGDDARG
jgi:[NiFe] hydrogenase assembly HybE family chaperone